MKRATSKKRAQPADMTNDFFRPDESLAPLIGLLKDDSLHRASDVIRWLCPRMGNPTSEPYGAMVRWIDQCGAVKKPVRLPVARKMIATVDDIAARNDVCALPDVSVLGAFKYSLGPTFNMDLDGTVLTLSHLRDGCRNRAVQSLLDQLLEHYRAVVQIGQELEGGLAVRIDEGKRNEASGRKKRPRESRRVGRGSTR